MSFSQEVREELIKHYDRAQHCQMAEIAAILIFGGRGLDIERETGKYIFEDPRTAGRNDFTVPAKTYNINERIDMSLAPEELIKKPEDKRAFIRGAFMEAGTISDPGKEYHLEFSAPDDFASRLILDVLEFFDISARTFKRRDSHTVVYVKGHEEISLILNIMSAHGSMMHFENIRIERELKGAVNRKLNCDTANINKSVSAAMKQIEDINLIMDNVDMDKLDEGLRSICMVRLANPDATISEIGELLTPRVSKSGANHRFRKISQMADEIRAKQQS